MFLNFLSERLPQSIMFNLTSAKDWTWTSSRQWATEKCNEKCNKKCTENV